MLFRIARASSSALRVTTPSRVHGLAQLPLRMGLPSNCARKTIHYSLRRSTNLHECIPSAKSGTKFKYTFAFGAAAAATSAITLFSLVSLNHAPVFSDSNVVFEGAEPLSEGVRIDPSTSLELPSVLRLTSTPPLTLLGLGVRTVSFLRVKVYVVGFYADLSNVDMKTLRSLEDSEKRIEYLINNTTCALRIVPTRSTSYTHLRDGFMRALQSRLVHFKRDGSMTPEQEEALQAPFQELKSLFPTTPFAKHTPLHAVLSVSPTGSRTLSFPDLGQVEDTWLATEFFKAYFVGNGISPVVRSLLTTHIFAQH